jgi:hypothetical protein
VKITNVNGLPEPLVRAVSRHAREHLPNHISVTELIQPPQLRALARKYDSELSEDASDRIWALLGTLLHQALEQHAQGLANLISEGFLETQILDWTVVGHYDLSEMLLEGELLTDYKLTSIWAIKDGVKPEWTAQLNLYAELLRRSGRPVTALQLTAIGRDWSLQKARFDSQYPQQQVQSFDVELWAKDKASEYLETRVRLHQYAQWYGKWPQCSEEERWARPTQWALMKKGQKRAVKLYDSLTAAERNRGALHYIQERPGESVRCASYCPVSSHCPQWAKLNQNNNQTKGEENEQGTTEEK